MRQKIARDDADRQRLIEGLEQAVIRYGWELPCYVVMGNYLHLLVKHPVPTWVPGCKASSRVMQSGGAAGGGDRAIFSGDVTAQR